MPAARHGEPCRCPPSPGSNTTTAKSSGRSLLSASLTLMREADNSFDERAVRMDWQGHKLGYIPRLDNAAVSQLLDRGETLDAVIVGLESSSNPWDRVKVEVRWRV